MHSQFANLSLRSELLEALDWDEDALAEVMKDCEDVLSEIKDINNAKETLQRLRDELSLSRGEEVMKLAITYYLNILMNSSAKEKEA